ncbi:YqaJ viral recombinase family protein [Arsenophonus endosymbiont of Aleurodicus floccissimus]|uniref:YqaJ viral recombinase family protein n=1 Tax=Arsenophonus endosymbiont of Aleurodicus floccissimus TaxID=2152761 RepID=UPI001EDCDC8B|nr:YqaJ viral recombinase family protein [Arsenophonus endosymbiont of Aleurodicus floccissimus]
MFLTQLILKRKKLDPAKTVKPMILNATNSKMVRQITGSPFLEDWQNVKVMICVERVKNRQEFVDELRIYPAITQKKILTPSKVESWERAKQSYLNTGSLEKVLAHVEMSLEDQEPSRRSALMQWYNVQQNTGDWDTLRLGKVSASQFSGFMANQGKAFGEPARRYALQIALKIINGKKSDVSFTNEHMLRGREQEPIARKLYEETNLVDVTNGGFFDCGKYGDSPDGLVRDDGVIAIKSVTAPGIMPLWNANLLTLLTNGNS